MMKHIQNQSPAMDFMKSRQFFITALVLFFIFSTPYVHASGAKLPTVSDGTEISDTTGDPIDTSISNDGTSSSETGGGSTSTPATNENYAHLDPGNIVPKALLTKALNYFESNKSKINNQNVIGVIDFSQHSSKERFYIIDMQSGRVETYQTAHGKNSDTDHDGYATQFSNTPGSLMSSQGIYLTAETYYGGKGYSLMLDGKSSTNSNARSRAIVIHPADYVQPGGTIGRSWGCPALDPRFSEEVIDRIKGGAVIYAQ